MHVLKFIFLTTIFSYMHLTTNGAKLKCYGFFGLRPPCFLYIDIIIDKFFYKTDKILPKDVLLKLNKIYSHKKYYYTNMVKELNDYIMGRYNQLWMKQICRQYCVRYRYETYITFFTNNPITQYEKDLFNLVYRRRKPRILCFKGSCKIQ
ncbi:Hypothetical protein SRAE_X000052300 [Strongyloides ratti]|uniref:Uncharacterized protein n=1 Tax=Strongyloides ratti TaxID=34506 RepID=A0A090LNA8_STRRB|nr:Hypothetical protein SRAE_X000052300 [Strongyloides ratti]CEF71196.2 Hypothetical protein SRAE_X000052300 [Strongyloides ratti]